MVQWELPIPPSSYSNIFFFLIFFFIYKIQAWKGIGGIKGGIARNHVANPLFFANTFFI